MLIRPGCHGYRPFEAQVGVRRLRHRPHLPEPRRDFALSTVLPALVLLVGAAMLGLLLGRSLLSLSYWSSR
jgi:hypothetical protein